MIKLAKGDWAHHTCVNWHREIWFDDDDVDLDYYGGTVNFKLFQTTCDLCGLRARGSCIPCDARYCCVHFHARCAIFAGLLYGTEERNPSGQVFCHKHQLIQSKRLKKGSKMKPVSKKETSRLDY